MDETPNLRLPYLVAAQAQKHVTHNEALRMLDAVVQLSVKDKDLSVPPATVADGDRYIVATPASGVFAGKEGQIAAFQDNAWMFYAPLVGWLTWIIDEERLYVFNGTSWVAFVGSGGGEVNPASLIGVNTTADVVNKLAVKSDAVLFSHDDVTPGSGDMRQVLNKASAGHTVSQLYQSNWSGRAETGLTGDDDWRVKVAPDGVAWKDAIVVNRASGAVRFPSGFVDATTLQAPVLLLPTTVKDIWRSDMDSPATPRTYTISAVSGSALTLSANAAEQIINGGMHGVSMVRIWNVSKSPAQAAWVDWQLAANQVRVHNAADIASWLPGETLRLGDPSPTGTNVINMMAIDISRHLLAAHGSVFRQRGLKISVAAQGVGGSAAMDASGNGAVGTAFGVASSSDGSRQSAFIDVFTTVQSPISNSNLLFVREGLVSGAALAATRLFRLVGVWV